MASHRHRWMKIHRRRKTDHRTGGGRVDQEVHPCRHPVEIKTIIQGLTCHYFNKWCGQEMSRYRDMRFETQPILKIFE